MDQSNNLSTNRLIESMQQSPAPTNGGGGGGVYNPIDTTE